MTINAAHLMVRCLEAEHVDYIFGIPGEENLNVMDALLDSSIQFVCTRHEQGAAFMADVYGRLTGKAGVCMSTLRRGDQFDYRCCRCQYGSRPRSRYCRSSRDQPYAQRIASGSRFSEHVSPH